MHEPKHTLLLERITWRLALRHIHDAVHVEAHFLGMAGPVLVAEAVGVLPVFLRLEAVVARCDAGFVHFVCVGWVEDLCVM